MNIPPNTSGFLKDSELFRPGIGNLRGLSGSKEFHQSDRATPVFVHYKIKDLPQNNRR